MQGWKLHFTAVQQMGMPHERAALQHHAAGLPVAQRPRNSMGQDLQERGSLGRLGVELWSVGASLKT